MNKDKPNCENRNCVKRGQNDFWVVEYYLSSHPYIDTPRHVCQLCGGIHDGEKWVYQCQTCSGVVSAGELIGLFVPHSCHTCSDKLVEEQRRKGHVCSRCRTVFAFCSC